MRRSYDAPEMEPLVLTPVEEVRAHGARHGHHRRPVSEYTLRPGTAADIETMARHRALMFADMGDGTPETRAEMSERFAPWVLERLASGEYHAWLIECDGGVVAGAACSGEAAAPRASRDPSACGLRP